MADNDTKKVDFQRSAELLHIVEKCAGHGPKLNALATAAMNELLELNEDLKQKAIEVEKKLADERAVVKAKADAKQAEVTRREEEAARPKPVVESRREEPDVRPPIYPQDSETATVADRRM